MSNIFQAWVQSYQIRLYKKLTGKQIRRERYAGKSVLSEADSNARLAQMIREGTPFMACRYGYVELETMAAVDFLRQSKCKTALRRVMKKGDICATAGFFPMDENWIVRFGESMMKWSANADLFGVWFIPFEEYAIRRYGGQANLTYLRAYEPWNASAPWTEALKGKKVLVVHPFAETIRSQYGKRGLLFEDDRVLPEFTLIPYKAVQTIAGTKDSRFENWFEALEHMRREISGIDFDVAILGCGAYGFPLASMIKDMGRQSVHMGGSTQLLFGIKGKRWDAHPIVSKLYNDNWVRPGVTDRPKDAARVENGCYW